ncbi:MAG: hypothetical protein ACR2QK_00880 [Acidimicrobiales bacterium]
MGVLDKLRFWKDELVDTEFEVNGCFTLPVDTTEEATAPDACEDNSEPPTLEG